MQVATWRLQFLEDAYDWAKAHVLKSGFSAEIEWQLNRHPQLINESEYLRESAWVILSGGMRESVIRAKFPEMSMAFCSWRSALEIRQNQTRCRQRALRLFAHPGKIDAILYVARQTAIDGFEWVSTQFRALGVKYLQQFPYLGPATSLHLAKNLGLDVAKPDRHLLRIAAVTGIGSVDELCRGISKRVGDPVAVVDLVLWRFATLHRDYLALFSPPSKKAIPC